MTQSSRREAFIEADVKPRTNNQLLIVGLNYSPEVTGIAPYTTALASDLQRRGNDVKVITGFPHYPAWKIDSRYRGHTLNERIGNVSVRRVRQFTPRSPSNLTRLLLELSFGIRAVLSSWGQPDGIICVSPSLISTGLIVVKARLRRNKIPVGIVVQDLYSLGLAETTSSKSVAALLMTKLESAILRRAIEVSVIHERFKIHLVDSLGLESDRISINANWTHLKQTAKTDPAAARRNFGWRPDEIIVLHAGNMGVKQGLENVVEAARLSDADKSKSVKFCLLGNGNQRERLQELARGVASIQFIDSLGDADYRAALGAADILLVNEKIGISEMSVPSKLTSYFSAGRPVLAAVASAGTTASEILRSGGGAIVSPGSPEELLNAVKNLVADQSRCRDLSAAALSYSQTHLNEISALNDYAEWVAKLARATRDGYEQSN